MSTLFEAVGHGFSADDPVVFGNCYPDPTTLIEGQTYYILATDLDADHFRISETVGGAALTLTAELDEFVVQAANSEYIPITDPADVMAPPPAPDPPSGLTLSSSVAEDADGHQVVRVKAEFTEATTPGLAGTNIEIATTASGPDWTTAQVQRAPLGATFVTFTVPGNLGYSVRAASEDVYGQTSSYTSIETHTATKDGDAPATPSSFTITGMPFGVVGDWAANTEADLSHYELQIADNSGFSNPTLFTFKIKTNTMPINPLSAGEWFGRVRAVDTSGNTSAYAATQSDFSRLIETADIDPDATIENATNLINGPATVTIDDNGITITDGALTLVDEFGETVLTASGFAGSWQEYLQLGLFNALMKAGVAGTVPNGRTAAFPYWTLSNDTGSPVATFQSGGGIRISFAATGNIKKLVSDPFKVIGGTDQPMIVIEWQWNFNNLSTAELEIEAYIEYSTDSSFTSVSEGEHLVDGALEIFGDTGEDRSVKVDAGALHEWARLVIEVKQLTAHHANNWLQINSAAVRMIPYWHGDVYIGEPDAAISLTRSMDPAFNVDANMTIDGYIDGIAPIVTVFTANGTWTDDNRARYVVVECIGGGGAGGSCQNTSSTQASAAGGGGGGGYARKLFTRAALDAAGDNTFAIVRGAGGSAGAAGNNDGGDGAASTFANSGITTVSGGGGTGGNGSAANSGPERNVGGDGGGASGGDINMSGQDGQAGVVTRGDGGEGDPTPAMGGMAARGGGGGRASAASGNGVGGGQYGGGGGGGWNANSQGSGRTGGAGANGVVIVTEYFGP